MVFLPAFQGLVKLLVAGSGAFAVDFERSVKHQKALVFQHFARQFQQGLEKGKPQA